MRRSVAGFLALVVVGLSAGCTATHNVTDTTRSASQQLLLNNALEGTLETIDFGYFTGMNVYYDGSGVDALDKGWVNHRVRESLATGGARLCATREEADVVVEAATGTYGTNTSTKSFGIQNMNMFPDMVLSRGDDQYGSAVLSVFATDRATGNLLWYTGPRRSDAQLKTRYLLGLGPFFQGTVKHPAETFEPFRSVKGSF